MYSPEQIEQVCELLEDDGLGLRVILRRLELSAGQFFRTLEADTTLAERYTRAKERQAELMADEIVEIADTCMEGEKVKTMPDGTSIVTTGDMIERSKLRVDSRKWVAAKLLPKKYGEKQQIEHSGEVKTTPDMDEEAIRVAYAALQRREEKNSG